MSISIVYEGVHRTLLEPELIPQVEDAGSKSNFTAKERKSVFIKAQNSTAANGEKARRKRRAP